ncbi:MAG TPA: 2-oxoglutarate dehydrogenase E1 component, partial [Vicinamibacterales bacterium]|nr:2-oxoglutarate dehydrogenase E1 component [Vicinamibacterales bacterium]
APPYAKEPILDRLISAEIFEEVLHARYPGTKRFSLEGSTAMIPLLDEILETSSGHGAVEALLGMSHRGRLNVMVHIVGKAPCEIFAGFEVLNPRSVLGGGDVKYHMGATGDYVGRSGRSLRIQLVSNPSHLEAVMPVVMGRARARQVRLDDDGTQIVPIVLHGDAAFAGQGTVAETLNYAEIDGFSVGGAIHIIVNNLMGFTTVPKELHATRFAADAAKRQPIPIFHVNGEDLQAVSRIGRLAVEYRRAFHSDVVIDLIGYRRHGHSEVDDPTVTHPVLYKTIMSRPHLWELFAREIGVDATARAQAARAAMRAAQEDAGTLTTRPVLSPLPDYWRDYRGGDHRPEYDVDTRLSAELIKGLGEKLMQVPGDFHVHPKVKRLLAQRLEMTSGKRPVDYGTAEALAFASLVSRGVPVRLSGQDSRRGTFNHRHAVLADFETQASYMPLAHIAPDQARCDIYNSTLSEAGILGFEYGYSRDYPEALVLWEAQFGDFANSAQVIIDQFIVSAEDKWRGWSGIALLLPHGYEGQGPEHSSARVERFLQLAAEDNIQVCQPSTAAQYFHLLRQQALSVWRTPLIVFTPKSLLRHPGASSSIDDFSTTTFARVLPDRHTQDARRILVCTGKIGHELRIEREKRKAADVAVVSIEQIYPFPLTELADALHAHPAAREIVWVQEEPANMGARSFVIPRLRRIADSRPVRSIRRSASASPATGSAKAHEIEQATLLQLAFSA